MEHIARKRRLAKRSPVAGRKGGEKGPPACASFFDVLAGRKSQRTFNSLGLSEYERGWIWEAVRLAPSSCNRQAIVVKVIRRRRSRLRLASLLVGGRGWLARATTILLLFADMKAYKSTAEREFMPWLDAGVVAENVCLTAEALGLGACFVNPNIREKDLGSFHKVFNPRGMRFCGAVALGNYGERDPSPVKRKREGIFYDEAM